MPGSVLRAKTSGENAACTSWLMSTPATKRTDQKRTSRKNSGLSEANDWDTIGGTLDGILMTMARSVKNFWTWTDTSATRMAVNSPREPRLSITSVPAAASS